MAISIHNALLSLRRRRMQKARTPNGRNANTGLVRSPHLRRVEAEWLGCGCRDAEDNCHRLGGRCTARAVYGNVGHRLRRAIDHYELTNGAEDTVRMLGHTGGETWPANHRSRQS